MVREDRRRGVHVEGLSEWVVRSPAGERQQPRPLGRLQHMARFGQWLSIHMRGCGAGHVQAGMPNACCQPAGQGWTISQQL